MWQDLDGSGCINTAEELQQFTLNLISKLRVSIPLDAVDTALGEAGSLLPEAPMDIWKFKRWFESIVTAQEATGASPHRVGPDEQSLPDEVNSNSSASEYDQMDQLRLTLTTFWKHCCYSEKDQRYSVTWQSVVFPGAGPNYPDRCAKVSERLMCLDAELDCRMVRCGYPQCTRSPWPSHSRRWTGVAGSNRHCARPLSLELRTLWALRLWGHPHAHRRVEIGGVPVAVSGGGGA